MESDVIQAKVATSLSIFSGTGLVINGMLDFLNHNAAAIGAVCCVVSTVSALYIRHKNKAK